RVRPRPGRHLPSPGGRARRRAAAARGGGRRPELVGAGGVRHRRKRGPRARDRRRADGRARRRRDGRGRALRQRRRAGRGRRPRALMRVVPVIDVKGGVAVHAVRGERDRYAPLQSSIAEGSDPVAVTRAVRDRLGLEELYVADLDAITGGGPGNADVVAALAKEARVMVDAGAATPAAAARLLELGAARVIVGTESLPGADAFARLRAELDAAPLVLSLDLRGGQVLSPDPALAGLAAIDAFARLAAAGVREAIVLDLLRVGSGEGPDVALIGELHARFPDV